jgi:hypothetical protein
MTIGICLILIGAPLISLLFLSANSAFADCPSRRTDLHAVHRGGHAVLNAGALRKTDKGAIIFPFDAIHLDTVLKAAERGTDGNSTAPQPPPGRRARLLDHVRGPASAGNDPRDPAFLRRVSGHFESARQRGRAFPSLPGRPLELPGAVPAQRPAGVSAPGAAPWMITDACIGSRPSSMLARSSQSSKVRPPQTRTRITSKPSESIISLHTPNLGMQNPREALGHSPLSTTPGFCLVFLKLFERVYAPLSAGLLRSRCAASAVDAEPCSGRSRTTSGRPLSRRSLPFIRTRFTINRIVRPAQMGGWRSTQQIEAYRPRGPRSSIGEAGPAWQGWTGLTRMNFLLLLDP